MTTMTTLNPADALARVVELLDLTMVRRKLMEPEEGTPATEAELNAMERDYRRFLALHLSHPEAVIVPTKLVDEMWHRHILDTAAYRRDCQAIFGRFLDHFPYFGMRGEEDAQALDDAFAATLELWERAFGDLPAGDQQAGRCRRQYAPMKCK